MSGPSMEALARKVDRTLNKNRKQNPAGFCVLVFGFGAPGISNYVSNARREDMIKALRETADRLEKNQDNPK